jgi:hypothetical protein
VPKAGDWFLKDVRICNASIIIVRDRNEAGKAQGGAEPNR